MYRSLDAADRADVKSAALMTDGRPEMPAVLMAITKGDFAAVEAFKLRSGWFEGTRRPMMVTPPM